MKEEDIVFKIFLNAQPEREEYQKLKSISIGVLKRRMLTIEKLYKLYIEENQIDTLKNLLRILKYTLEDIETDGDSIYRLFVDELREFTINIATTSDQQYFEKLINLNHILSQIDSQS
jgi:hypothetical protein